MSSIYKTGAISVNNGSNIVTGNGTSFLGVAGTLAGDLFSVDGVNFYEIYQVDSNNQIRIRTIPAGLPFQQSSKLNSYYAILRNFTSSTSAEVAARVVAVQQKWHLREEEMTGWFASTDDYYNVTSINGDIISVMTPAGIANLLGTAATRDVGTSAGNVMEVGAFGIGASSTVNPPNLDLNDVTNTGFYTISGSVANAPPNMLPINAVVLHIATTETLHTQIAMGRRSSQMFIRYNDGAWSDWVEFFNESNSVNPLDYGVGGVTDLPSGSSLLGVYENGIYYVPDAVDRPTGNATNWYLIVENVKNNQQFRKHTATPINVVDGSSQPYIGLFVNGVFEGWDRGAIDYGWGTKNIGISSGFDFGNVLYETGLYPINLNDSTGNKPLATGFGTVLQLAGTSGVAGHQMFLSREQGNDLLYLRTKRNASVDYDDWVGFYHSGNTNFNEFGGINNNDTVAVGASASTSLAIFYLPINSKSKPTSISVTGTFKIRLPFSGTDLATNVVPSINLDASSNTVAALTVSGLSGLPNAGSVLELRTETASSKITVNF